MTDSTKLQAVFEAATDGIVIINERGIIETINRAAAQMFEYQPEELVGHNVSILMGDRDRKNHNRYIQNYKDTGVGKIIGIGREVTGRKKSGALFPCLLSISEVALPEGTIFAGILHDISELKQAQERLRDYARQLERSNRELQDFAYISSHDLQEPLRKIQAFGNRVKSLEQDKFTEKGADYLERMLTAAARMQNLINDLLSFSRVSTKARPFEQIQLNAVLREVVFDLEVAIEEANAEVQIENLPVVEADKVQMRQLFQNLLSNAIKFRHEAVPVQIHVRPVDNADQNTWAIAVSDNGIGFDEKYADRIFNVFQRLEGRKYEGSGIGLAICKKIVHRHGGDIQVRSTPGKGTTFTILLPKKPILN
ncbi:MAG: ATP-binding protein [Bernardetiaceae bacterium]